MKKFQVQFLCVLFLHFALFSKAQSLITQTYSFSGATQTFVMPPCTGNFTIQLKGAKGGDGGDVGGQGAALSAVCAATP
jgi:hypothetical protein